MNTERIKELEQKAIRRYIDNSDWDSVIDMLSEEEQEEYNGLLSSPEETETPNYRIDGWNIFYFVEDEEGNISRHIWKVSNWLSNQIDEEFEEFARGYITEE